MRMIKFGREERKKRNFSETNEPIAIFEINRNNMVLSDVVQTKKRFKCFVGYLDGDDIKPLSITLPKMS